MISRSVRRRAAYRHPGPRFGLFLLLLGMAAIAAWMPRAVGLENTLVLHQLVLQAVTPEGRGRFLLFFSRLGQKGQIQKPVQGIDKYKLTINGQDVSPERVFEAREQPAELLVLVDTGRDARAFVQQIRVALASELPNFPQTVRVALWSFDEAAPRPLTSGFLAPKEAEQAVQHLAFAPERGACVYQALYQALEAFEAEGASQVPRMVLLVSPGLDRNAGGGPCSQVGTWEVQERARRLGVPLFWVVVGGREDPNLATLISESGGLVFFQNPQAIVYKRLQAFRQMLENQMALAFVYPYRAGEELRISLQYVKLTSPVRTFIVPTVPGVVLVTPSATPLASPTPSPMVTPTLTFLFPTPEPVTPESTGALPTFEVPIPTPQPAVLEPAVPGPPTQRPSAGPFGSGVVWFLLSCVAAFFLTTGAGLLWRKYRKRHAEQTQFYPSTALEAMEQPEVQPFVPAQQEEPPTSQVQAEPTVNILASALEPALAAFQVLQSEDPTYVNKTVLLLMSERRVALGRSVKNEIPFPKDATVSRLHAVVRFTNGEFVLEPPASGMPRHGIFVNDEPLQGPVVLQDGDVIRLGRTVRLRFRLLEPERTQPAV